MKPSNRHFCSIPDASRNTHLGNVYLIAEKFDAMDKLTRYLNDKSKDAYYVPYKPVYMHDFSEITDEPLRRELQINGANVATQVFMPDKYEPFFLYERTELNDIESAVTGLVEDAERLSKESVCRAIVNYATNEPDACKEWLSSEMSGNAADNVFGKVLPCGKNPSFKGSNSHSASINARWLAMMEEFADARDNFVTYVEQLSSEDPEQRQEAAQKVDKFLAILTEKQKNEIFRLYLASLNAKDLQQFRDEKINPDGILEKSKIKVEVEKSNDCKNNDGFYRLFCTFEDKNRTPLKFSLKSTTIVYLMLLIARKNCSDRKSTFSFDKNNPEDKALFVKLMTTLYEKNEREAEGDYYNLFADSYGNQGRLKDSIANCKKVLSKAVEDHENPYPFLPNKIEERGFTYYLPILPENIVFDKSFSDIFLNQA